MDESGRGDKPLMLTPIGVADPRRLIRVPPICQLFARTGLAGRAVDGHRSAVQLGQRFRERQAETGAGVCAVQGAVDLAERREREIDIIR